MTEFGAAAALELSVSDREIRQARREIEDGIGEVNMSVSPSEMAGGIRGGAGDIQTDLVNLAKEEGEKLDDIIDILEDIRNAGIDGGGRSGGLLNTIGAAGSTLASGAIATGATLTGAATIGTGVGLASVRGLEEAGALDAVEDAGQGFQETVGQKGTDALLTGANFATGGDFSSIVGAGGALRALASGEDLSSVATEGVRAQEAAEGIDVEQQLQDAQLPELPQPSGDFWPQYPALGQQVQWPDFPALSQNADWPDFPALDQQVQWPDLPQPSADFWPDIQDPFISGGDGEGGFDPLSFLTSKNNPAFRTGQETGNTIDDIQQGLGNLRFDANIDATVEDARSAEREIERMADDIKKDIEQELKRQIPGF